MRTSTGSWQRGYGVLAKGCSNRRSAQLVQQVRRWYAVGHDKFVGCVPTPDGFVRPVHTFAIRYATPTQWKHTYLLSTLQLSAVATALLYDQRGGAETEFRADKSGGLHLQKRRKHKRDAQEVWSLAHRSGAQLFVLGGSYHFRRQSLRRLWLATDYP